MKYSTPSKQGVNPRAIMSFIDEIERENIEMHSLVIIKNGYIVAEGYWKPYTADRLHELYSATKVFISMAIGFAIDEGLLSLDDTLYKIFPDKFPENVDERTKDITVHHLLTMSSGIKSGGAKIWETGDPVKEYVSRLQTADPGTKFEYSSTSSHMLSEIIYKVTGMQLEDYVRERVLEPLDIKAEWIKTPQGVTYGGAGLRTTPVDLAKAGLLLMQNGVWEDKQILPLGWAEAMTEKKIDTSGHVWDEWQRGYCYQLWRAGREGSYRIDGGYGQYSLVYPKENMVIAITAADDRRPLTMKIVGKHLFETVDTEDIAGDTLLKDKLGGLTLEKEPIIVRRSETERDITSKAYYFEENEMSMVPLGEKWVINDDSKNIQYMQFDFCDKYMLLRWQEAGKFSCIKIGMDGNDIEDTYRTDCCDKVVLSRAHWEDDKTLVIIMRSIEIVTTYTLRCTFEDNTVRVTMRESMPICNDEYVPLIGKQG